MGDIKLDRTKFNKGIDKSLNDLIKLGKLNKMFIILLKKSIININYGQFSIGLL